MTQASMLMYGARLNPGADSEVTRHWPSGIFSILLGLQTMSASLAAGAFLARRRALMLAPQVCHACSLSASCTPAPCRLPAMQALESDATATDVHRQGVVPGICSMCLQHGAASMRQFVLVLGLSRVQSLPVFIRPPVAPSRSDQIIERSDE